MEIRYYKPTNQELSKYIEGYYFISPNHNLGNLNYFTYPNNFVILSINYGGKILLEQGRIIVKKDKSIGIECAFVSRFLRPIEVIYDDEVFELTLYFKPFGINHFIEENPAGQNLNHYCPYDDFKSFFKHLLQLTDRKQQIEELERYLLSKLKPRPFPLIEAIVRDFENELSVSESAVKNNISRQYLNRIFLKYIGKSPAEFKKIQRFRKAIGSRQQQKNLTELSHESLFYDQSHFIKNLKEITEIQPSKFFKEIHTDQEIAWLFI